MTNRRIKPIPLIIGILILFVAIWKGVPMLLDTEVGQKIVPSKKTDASQIIEAIKLPDAPANIESTSPPRPHPSSTIAVVNAPEIRYDGWAWNAQMGFFYANGGTETTKGSIMEQRGINLKIKRNDDVPQMQANLVAFAKAYKESGGNPNVKEGVHYVSIMGDAAGQFLAGVNPQLEKIGPEYVAEVIGSLGRSLGEDKLMGPKEWLENPQNAKGKTIATVIRDGDWNIVVMWAASNGIKINPDETTYDPEAINFINAPNYIEAAQMYINGYSEERPIVKNGKIDVLSGKEKVHVDGVSTWTPGDVMITTEKGGLISIVSTAEYRSQMPNVLIGIKKYNKDNASMVENLLAGAFEGADQVKGYKEALDKAGELSAKIYSEEDGAYWVKYYKGAQIADKEGNVVKLGGSRVNNLADNLEFFGLAPGSTDVYETVYNTFGKIVTQMYPRLVPSVPEYSEVVNLTYLKNLASTYKPSEITAPDEVKFNTDAGITETVSRKAWSIEFEVGKATLKPSSIALLQEIKAQGQIGSGMQIRIEGHTDNTGSDEINIPLSKERANTVRNWLIENGGNSFKNRVATQGYGSTRPARGAESNATENERRKNRRVEIIMGI